MTISELMVHMRNDKIFVDSLILFFISDTFHISLYHFSESNPL